MPYVIHYSSLPLPPTTLSLEASYTMFHAQQLNRAVRCTYSVSHLSFSFVHLELQGSVPETNLTLVSAVVY